MPLVKRIIPCLDVRDGKVVKGVSFRKLRAAGDPAELARRYDEEGADELVLLDITASLESRRTMLRVVEEVADNVTIPFTVGGGVRSLEDVESLLCSGADKVSVNTAAVKNPVLITRLADRFGSQCVVVAIDAKRVGWGWEVYIYGGRTPTGMDAVNWARKAESLGAGELLVTSIDADGGRRGYDLELLRRITSSVNIPVIASGGAGGPRHVYEALTKGGADAALAASIFHYGVYTVMDVKNYLAGRGVPVRLNL